MKLKHGKKYETADGVVYLVRKHPEFTDMWDINDETDICWNDVGRGYDHYPDLIRRHYTKPKPAHKLDLKPGDVVELVSWEHGFDKNSDEHITVTNGSYILAPHPKGERPLFLVVSRASYPMPTS